MEDIVSRIRKGPKERESVIKSFYQDIGLQNGFKKIIGNSANPTLDFENLFNLTLVQFLKTVITNKDFVIQKNVNSYLFGIARHLLLRMRDNKTVDLDHVVEQETSEENIDLVIINNEKKAILREVLKRLGIKCKEVLIFWASGYKMREIALRLDYASDVVARRKKFSCMKELSNYVESNPRIKAIFKS